MKDYTLGLYEKSMPNELNLKEKLKCTKDCGFDYLEISIDETPQKLQRLDMPLSERLELVSAMYENNTFIRTMCLSGHRKYPLGSKDLNTRKTAMEIMEKAIDLASDLGVRIIQLAGYDVYYEKGDSETEKLFIENLKKSVELASKQGIILAFETMETEFMDTVEKAMKYVNLINSPYLKVYPDCGNVKNASLIYDISVEEDFKKGSGHITSVHLKEAVPGKYREIKFGTGHVDFENIINTSMNMGVKMFTLEFWHTGNNDWLDVIKESKEFINTKFKNILLNNKYSIK